jgi:hypothetical protein
MGLGFTSLRMVMYSEWPRFGSHHTKLSDKQLRVGFQTMKYSLAVGTDVFSVSDYCKWSLDIKL